MGIKEHVSIIGVKKMVVPAYGIVGCNVWLGASLPVTIVAAITEPARHT